MSTVDAGQARPRRKQRKKKQKPKQLYVDKNVLELAQERMSYLFDRFDTVSVSFSGGKDSTVTLELALAEAERRGRLPLEVVFFDEEAIPWETEEYVRRRYNDPRIHLRWFAIPLKHRNACARDHPYWWPWAPEDRDKWCREMPPEAIDSLEGFPMQPPQARMSTTELNGLLFPVEKYGMAVQLLGTRAHEGLGRRRMMLMKGVDNYVMHYEGPTARENLFTAYPIYDWRTDDIWHGIRVFGWDYNKAYDLQNMHGITAHDSRVAPPFGEEPIKGLKLFKTCHPELWERMVNRVPGANTAIQYSKTELYLYGKRPPKPPDMTWEEYIVHYIRKFPTDVQKLIGNRVRSEIKRHYATTPDPILYKTPHWVTGLHWDFLLSIAGRGDLKSRKVVTSNLAGRTDEENRKRYLAALKEERPEEYEHIARREARRDAQVARREGEKRLAEAEAAESTS